jgi:hypothetical protein
VRVESGKARCRFHGGLSTGPRSEEGRARISEAQRRRWRAYRASKLTKLRYNPRSERPRSDSAEPASAFSEAESESSESPKPQPAINGHGARIALTRARARVSLTKHSVYCHDRGLRFPSR